MEPINVSILGLNPILLEGLGRILAENDFEVHQVVDDPAKLTGVESDLNGSHLILIESFAGAQGADFLLSLRHRFPSARLVLLVEDFDLAAMIDSFRAGAHGYIVKKMSVAPLIASLRLVAMGEKVMPSFLADVLPEMATSPVSPGASQSLEAAGLSSREVDILLGLIAGHPNKVISRQLNISEATVKVHVKAILRKVGVQNRTQAAIWAVGEKWDDAVLRRISGGDPEQRHSKGSEAAAV
jgi:two-component system, NarL family, nitrate/nitrite response regulator NarL